MMAFSPVALHGGLTVCARHSDGDQWGLEEPILKDIIGQAKCSFDCICGARVGKREF